MDNLDLDPELAALLEDIPDTLVKKTPSIKKESLFILGGGDRRAPPVGRC